MGIGVLAAADKIIWSAEWRNRRAVNNVIIIKPDGVWGGGLPSFLTLQTGR